MTVMVIGSPFLTPRLKMLGRERLFQQRVGLAPTAYRKRFQPAAITPTGRRR